MRPAHPAAPSLYSAVTTAVVMATIGALAVMLRQPLLFPSLGPTIFIQAVTPNQPAGRPWNTLAGHAVGVAAAFVALALFGAFGDPPAQSTGALTVGRMLATALAVGLTVVGQIAIGGQHPPAAATTMLLTLGGMDATGKTIIDVAVGVALVTMLGETARRLHPHHDASPRQERTTNDGR